MRKWFYLLLTAYFAYLMAIINPYLSKDESSNVITSLLIKRLILQNNLTINKALIFLKTSQAHYPAINLKYNILYSLINSLLPSIFLMKLLTVVLSITSLILLYSILKNKFNESISLLTILLTMTSRWFIKQSIMINPQIMALTLFLTGLLLYLKKKNSLITGLSFGLSVLLDVILIVPVIITLIINLRNNFSKTIKIFIILLLMTTPLFIIHEIDFFNKNIQVSIIYLLPLISLLISYFIIIIYNKYNSKIKILILFLLITLMIIQLPLMNNQESINLSIIAEDLIKDPNSTILLISKNYDNQLMYESFIRDRNINLRFVKPTNENLINQINEEKINKIVVIGETGLNTLNQELLNNRYQLIKSYNLKQEQALVYDTRI